MLDNVDNSKCVLAKNCSAYNSNPDVCNKQTISAQAASIDANGLTTGASDSHDCTYCQRFLPEEINALLQVNMKSH